LLGCQLTINTSNSSDTERTRHCFFFFWLIAFCRVHRPDRRIANEASAAAGWQSWANGFAVAPLRSFVARSSSSQKRKKRFAACLFILLCPYYLDSLEVSDVVECVDSLSVSFFQGRGVRCTTEINVDFGLFIPGFLMLTFPNDAHRSHHRTNLFANFPPESADGRGDRSL
jgi:hypothetical protein